MCSILNNSVNSTKKICHINEIFCKVDKGGQPIALVVWNERVWSDEQKFSSSKRNIFLNQPSSQQNDFIQKILFGVDSEVNVFD